MKKWLIGSVILICILLLSIVMLIPGNLRVSNVVVMKANRYAALRNLHDQEDWIKWWPKKEISSVENNHPSLGGYTYNITNKFYNGIDIDISDKNNVYKGKAYITPFADSIAIQFETRLHTGMNPILKIVKYREAVKLKNDFRTILDSLKSFNEDRHRVYRFNLHNTTLTDTSLIAIKITTKDTPSTAVIYSLVDALEGYIANQKAKETNLPILNVSKAGDKGFVTMVAIATDRSLPGNGRFAFKRMIPYKNKILVADVKGGPGTIQQGYDEIDQYMKDYELSSPVIPFEYLVTDRSKEPDTSKWITKIYMPIK